MRRCKGDLACRIGQDGYVYQRQPSEHAYSCLGLLVGARLTYRCSRLLDGLVRVRAFDSHHRKNRSKWRVERSLSVCCRWVDVTECSWKQVVEHYMLHGSQKYDGDLTVAYLFVDACLCPVRNSMLS